MNRTALLLAFAAAVSARSASAQVRVNWNAQDFGTPSVKEFVSGQPAPAEPKAAPAPVKKASEPCPDGIALAGRSMKVMLAVQGQEPRTIDFAYDHCSLEIPRDEPPALPYTYRAYKSASGDWLGVYTGSDKPAATTLSLRLADGSDAATLMPILSTSDLAAGKTLELGEILLVGLAKGDSAGKVLHARASIKSVPSR